MRRTLLFVPLLLAAGLLLAAPFAQSASSSVVVAELYAGGGNSGATYANDYVTLLNRGSTAVDVGGWTLQYASATSTSWQPTALSGSIQPGRYFLVQLASGGTAGAALPAPDATGTTNLANSGGKVALVRDATALSCGGSAGSCAGSSSIADLVGYGSATDFEGAGAAAAPSNTTALARANAGCSDGDDNAADFATTPPTPRSSAAPATSCAVGTTSTTTTTTTTAGASASQGAAVDVQVQPVLSIALERSSISFGAAVAGDTPAPISERVTVLSNDAAGYTVGIHRTAFAPADLPLAVAVGAGPMTPIPVAPSADLVLATTSAPSVPAGDVVPASVGFSAPLPVVGPGRYAATVTFTVIGR
jgi:predicted extracellular nuclease